MPIGRCACAIGHGQDDSSSNRPGQLDHFVNLLVSGTHLLRTCEVGHRSRFAVQRQDQREVDQLLGLAIQRPIGVNLLEVGGEVLVRAEIGCSLGHIRHVFRLPPRYTDLGRVRLVCVFG